MDITLDDIKDMVDGYTDYGRYIAIVCPFHDDHSPSLLAYGPRNDNERGFFQCKSCGRSGNLEMLHRGLVGFIPPGGMMFERTNYDAPRLPTDLLELEELCFNAHRMLMEHYNQLSWYLEDRGVEWCIEPCRLGWFDGWYTIPIRDANDRFQGVIMRAGPHVQETSDIRFHQPKGQGPMMYMPDRALAEKSKVLFVVFGMVDVLALVTLRFPVCTTTAGKDSFDPSWLDSIRKPVVVVPDKGEDKSARHLASKLGWRGRVLSLPYDEHVKDPADYLKHKRGDELTRLLAPYVA